jgi:glycosyltransferase involved in cell wall biosynthesis
MRILMLTDGVSPFVIGGMQKHSFYLAKHLLKNGVDLTLYHCVYGKDNTNINKKLKSYLNVKDSMKFQAKCFRFPKLRISVPGHYVIESYLYSKKLYNEILNEKKDFDFIYAKGFSGWYSIRKKNKLPKIGIQFHGLEMFQKASTFFNYLEKIILRNPVKYNLRNANFVFCYGAKIKDLHEKLGCKNDKIFLQHGGVSKEHIIRNDEIKKINDKIRFLFIGRNERRKGYIELRKALEILKDKKDFHFSFIGDIPESQKLISSKITYYGIIKNQEKYLNIIDENDVIVVPSISEGLPTVLIETMARGLVALATDVGAINEIVNNENGYLIDHSNHLEIINKMEKIIELPKHKILEKKQKAREIINAKFDWENLSKELIKFIKENNL